MPAKRQINKIGVKLTKLSRRFALFSSPNKVTTVIAPGPAIKGIANGNIAIELLEKSS